MNKPLRVLQIVPSVSLVYGGPSQMILGLSAALAQLPVELTLITTDSNGDVGQPPLDVPINQPIQQQGYVVRYFRCSPFRRYKFSVGLLQWLWEQAPSFDIAHIHALFSPVSTAAATIARWRGLPYLLRPLGTLDPADLRKKKQLKQLYGRLLEGPNLKGAAAIHFTSPQEVQVSERFGAQTTDVVIPLGVEAPQKEQSDDRATTQSQLRSQLGLPNDVPILLYMSRIDPKKGLDLLFPALQTLQQEGCPFHFVLAGSNPQDPAYEQQIQNQIQACGLGEQTTITGIVTGDRKYAFLAAADLFVLPSYYENFGIAVVEAMLAGLPVVISEQVYIWENIQAAKAGWVTRCDQAELTNALRTALNDPQACQQFGNNGRRYAQTHYSWPAIAQQTLDTYLKLLQRS
ncbi:MAG: hormogonium polysaccharide biosynthesis glycosyltransferase HpsP [Cyanobacteria bacterium P01_H01_bin.121]